MNIGDQIKKYRTEQGLTLEEVAKSIGVSRQTMSRYETGVITNIPSDKIEAIAQKLGVSPAILMGWTPVWEKDQYEDYHSPKNSDDDRRHLLKSWGIPSDLQSDANRLFGSPAALVNNDAELTNYLEELRTRPEMRMLFSVAKDATKEDVEKAVAIIEALRKTEGK